jgi:hypothetical protein
MSIWKIITSIIPKKLPVDLCSIGRHEWKSIRRTNYNTWSGDICVRCGASRSTIQRIYNQMSGEKRNVANFYRVAGGTKPMPYDK